MRKVAAFFLALCAGVFSNNNVANADVYTLDFYNVDDLMTGYITNSKNIDTPILQVSFLGNSGPVDISPYVTDGLNDIHIQEYNDYQGWTFGYTFAINGSTVSSGSCGVANYFGCNNNAQGPINAVVFATDIQFNVANSVVRGVPEPSTWVMMLLGFAGIGLTGYRRIKTSTTAA